MELYDVVICGYGPTGMAAASLLSQRGHRVCVLERWPTLYGQPRMATIDGEAARIIQNAGAASNAFRNSVPRPRYILANAGGQVLVDHDWDREHICGYPHRISLHQPDIEDAMDAKARKHGAEINQGWEVVGLTQDSDIVSLTARQRLADGTSYGPTRVVAARYAIGSDGARSAVREALGVKRENWPFRGAWLSFDAVRKRELPNLLGLSPDGRIAVVCCVPEGKSHSVIPLGIEHLRFNFYVDPDTPHEGALRRDLGMRLIREVYGVGEDDIAIYRESLYAFEGRMAAQWRVGRVFLAGDAAHLMTPFYGQGGCSGLRDAINLSWKLDLVLSGRSNDALLDSYEAERMPDVRVHVENADKLAAQVFLADPRAAAERDRAFLSGVGVAPLPVPAVIDGVVDLNGGEASPAVGRVGPQGLVATDDGRALLDEVAGWGFQLVTLERQLLEGLSPENQAFLSTLGCYCLSVDEPERDLSGTYGEYFRSHAIAFAIMRPDFIVFAAGRTAADLARAVDSLRQQLLFA